MKNTGAVAEHSHRKCSSLLGLAVFTCGLSLSALAESDPNTCIGVDFDAKRPLTASRVTARPHVNFVKGSDDDAGCPAGTEACRKKAFVVPGDIVLTGRAQGAFTCVAYQSFHARKQDWTTGWNVDDFLDTRRTGAVAEDNGLDRFVVSPRRNNLDFARQERGVEH